jgi:hypothetical protein
VGAPRAGLGAERAREREQAEPAVAAPAGLEAHDAGVGAERRARDLGERGAHRRRIELPEAEAVGVAGEALAVARDPPDARAVPAPGGVAGEAGRDRRVVGGDPCGGSGEDLAVEPDRERAAQERCAIGTKLRCCFPS